MTVTSMAIVKNILEILKHHPQKKMIHLPNPQISSLDLRIIKSIKKTILEALSTIDAIRSSATVDSNNEISFEIVNEKTVSIIVTNQYLQICLQAVWIKFIG